ncbi:hypothetical protein D3C87_1821990 [compost metagenome]
MTPQPIELGLLELHQEGRPGSEQGGEEAEGLPVHQASSAGRVSGSRSRSWGLAMSFQPISTASSNWLLENSLRAVAPAAAYNSLATRARFWASSKSVSLATS